MSVKSGVRIKRYMEEHFHQFSLGQSKKRRLIDKHNEGGKNLDCIYKHIFFLFNFFAEMIVEYEQMSSTQILDNE